MPNIDISCVTLSIIWTSLGSMDLPSDITRQGTSMSYSIFWRLVY